MSRNYLVNLVFQKYIDGYDLKIHPDTHTNTQTHRHKHTHTDTHTHTHTHIHTHAHTKKNLSWLIWLGVKVK